MSKSYIAYFLLGVMGFNLVGAQADPFADFPVGDDSADPFAENLFGEDPFGGDLFGDTSVQVDAGGTATVETGNTFVEADPFAGVTVATPSEGSAGLPSSAQTSFSVVNMSKDNADATQSGVQAGDILQYTFAFESNTEDVTNFIANFDVSGLIGKVEFTELGLGQLNGNMITYPSYSNKAPCDSSFSFVVRVKPCDELDSKNLSASIDGLNRSLAVSCGLSPTGPSQYIVFASVLAIMSLMVIFFFSRRRI